MAMKLTDSVSRLEARISELERKVALAGLYSRRILVASLGALVMASLILAALVGGAPVQLSIAAFALGIAAYLYKDPTFRGRYPRAHRWAGILGLALTLTAALFTFLKAFEVL